MFGLRVFTPQSASTLRYCCAVRPTAKYRALIERRVTGSVAVNTSMPGILSGSTPKANAKAFLWNAKPCSLVVDAEPPTRVTVTTSLLEAAAASGGLMPTVIAPPEAVAVGVGE